MKISTERVRLIALAPLRDHVEVDGCPLGPRRPSTGPVTQRTSPCNADGAHGRHAEVAAVALQVSRTHRGVGVSAVRYRTGPSRRSRGARRNLTAYAACRSAVQPRTRLLPPRDHRAASLGRAEWQSGARCPASAPVARIERRDAVRKPKSRRSIRADTVIWRTSTLDQR